MQVAALAADSHAGLVLEGLGMCHATTRYVAEHLLQLHAGLLPAAAAHRRTLTLGQYKRHLAYLGAKAGELCSSVNAVWARTSLAKGFLVSVEPQGNAGEALAWSNQVRMHAGPCRRRALPIL